MSMSISALAQQSGWSEADIRHLCLELFSMPYERLDDVDVKILVQEMSDRQISRRAW